MPAGCVTGRGDRQLAQWMPHADDTDETITEQRLRAHLRSRGLSDDARFKIYAAVAQVRIVLVRLQDKPQPHARCLLADARNEIRSEILNEAVLVSEREGPYKFGPLNMALLVAAVFGAGFFVLVEARVASPLVRLAAFRNATLSTSLATSALVSTVMMATLVVGPFYLSRALGLDAALVGTVMSVGPLSPR